MITFKQFREEINKPSIGAAAKAGQLIAAPIAFVTRAGPPPNAP